MGYSLGSWLSSISSYLIFLLFLLPALCYVYLFICNVITSWQRWSSVLNLDSSKHRRQRYVHIAIFLSLALLLRTSVLTSISLFLLTCLYLSSLLIFNSTLLSLLTLLVYLGALIVLFAYLWIFMTFSSPFSPYLLFSFSLFSFLFSGGIPLPSPLSPFLISSSLLLYLVCLLFWAIVVVVQILDLSLGGFTA